MGAAAATVEMIWAMARAVADSDKAWSQVAFDGAQDALVLALILGRDLCRRQAAIIKTSMLIIGRPRYGVLVNVR